jgi:hypothetical protein
MMAIEIRKESDRIYRIKTGLTGFLFARNPTSCES